MVWEGCRLEWAEERGHFQEITLSPLSLQNPKLFFFFSKIRFRGSFCSCDGPSASGTFELAIPGTDIRFSVVGVVMWGSWGLVKMPVHLLVLLRTRQEHGATTLGKLQGQGVGGEDLTPRGMWLPTWLTLSAHTFSLGTSRICTSSVTVPHGHSCFDLSARKLHLLDYLGQGQKWPVSATHKSLSGQPD